LPQLLFRIPRRRFLTIFSPRLNRRTDMNTLIKQKWTSLACRPLTWGIVGCLLTLASTSARAQFKEFNQPAEKRERHGRFGAQDVQTYRVGMEVRAIGGPCKGLYGTLPVPTDWPEQQVRVVDEELTDNVRHVRYRVLDGGVKQMQISIPSLNAGETAKAFVKLEVTKKQILPPSNPAAFVFPENPPMEIRKYLAPSPYIESRHPQIRDFAKQVVKDKVSAGEKVEAIYDYVRENVVYKNGKLKGALAALRDGDGDCEELTSLFIALCRANGIPARTVWVPDHCYPEFYLIDSSGNGYWLPCQAAGEREFGGMSDTRSILQKGDNFKVPEKREPQRYVSEFLKGNAVRGGGRPAVKFVRETL